MSDSDEPMPVDADTVLRVQQESLRRLEEMQKRDRERHRQAAENPRYRQYPQHYAQAARKMALRDFWALEEATNLLCGCDPYRPGNLPGHGALEARLHTIREALRRADLPWHGRWGGKRLKSADVLAWARKKGLDIPSALLVAMQPQDPAGGAQEGETPGRASQIDRQLCRAVAQTLWDEYPDMTIAELVEHRAVRRYANGAQYRPDTLRRWIRNLDPRPKDAKKGGRPRKR